LYGTLKEAVYIEQLDGYITPERRIGYRLKKGLYSLEQAGEMWGKELNIHTEGEVSITMPEDLAIYIIALG
jgi:hypothetical protein